jgi:hypothetical protein
MRNIFSFNDGTPKCRFGDYPFMSLDAFHSNGIDKISVGIIDPGNLALSAANNDYSAHLLTTHAAEEVAKHVALVSSLMKYTLYLNGDGSVSIVPCHPTTGAEETNFNPGVGHFDLHLCPEFVGSASNSTTSMIYSTIFSQAIKDAGADYTSDTSSEQATIIDRMFGPARPDKMGHPGWTRLTGSYAQVGDGSTTRPQDFGVRATGWPAVSATLIYGPVGTCHVNLLSNGPYGSTKLEWDALMTAGFRGSINGPAMHAVIAAFKASGLVLSAETTAIDAADNLQDKWFPPTFGWSWNPFHSRPFLLKLGTFNMVGVPPGIQTIAFNLSDITVSAETLFTDDVNAAPAPSTVANLRGSFDDVYFSMASSALSLLIDDMPADPLDADRTATILAQAEGRLRNVHGIWNPGKISLPVTAYAELDVYKEYYSAITLGGYSDKFNTFPISPGHTFGTAASSVQSFGSLAVLCTHPMVPGDASNSQLADVLAAPDRVVNATMDGSTPRVSIEGTVADVLVVIDGVEDYASLLLGDCPVSVWTFVGTSESQIVQALAGLDTLLLWTSALSDGGSETNYNPTADEFSATARLIVGSATNYLPYRSMTPDQRAKFLIATLGGNDASTQLLTAALMAGFYVPDTPAA